MKGYREFILEEPVVPALTDQDLVVVADLTDVRTSESGSELGEQNQRNTILDLCFPTSWRQVSSWQLVHAARRRSETCDRARCAWLATQ